MSYDALAIIREEADRLAAVLDSTDPDRTVPSCPDWTAADLLWHLTEVHDFWGGILAARATTDEEAEGIEEGIGPRPEDLSQVRRRRSAATALLLDQLQQRTDDEVSWFWYSAEQTVGVVRRMQMHEATIHRVDAELTAGLPITPIDPEVAVAGLRHMVEVMWPSEFDWIPQWARTTPVARVDIAADGQEPLTLLISRWRGTRPRDGESFDVPVARLMAQEDLPPAATAGPGSASSADGPGRADDAVGGAGSDGDLEAGSVSELPAAEVTGTAQALNFWAWGRSLALEGMAEATPPMRITGEDRAVAELSALVDEGID